MSCITPHRFNNSVSKIFSSLGLGFLLLVFATPGVAQTWTLVVDRTDDAVGVDWCTSAPDDCNLRGAINRINFRAGGDIITFAASTNGIPMAISLPGYDNKNRVGDFDILKPVTIVGNGATNTLISGNGIDRVFNIMAPGGVTTIEGVRIFAGNSNLGGGISAWWAFTLINSVVTQNYSPGGGGGIYSWDAVTITNSTVSENIAEDYGGIYATGALTVLGNSTISGNRASRWFGGAFSGGPLTMTNSTVSGNEAGVHGGGIYSVGTMALTNSTISNNHAGTKAGGILGSAFGGGVTLTNSTISGNTAGRDGGGVFTYPGSVLTLVDSAVSGNTAKNSGAGIYSGDTLTMTNSIVFGNMAGNSAAGIYVASKLTATLVDSAVSSNSAGNGGGIFTRGPLTLTGSTVSANTVSGNYGGIFSTDMLTLTNSTISGNNAGGYGGIYAGNGITTTNSTVFGNSSKSWSTSGGVYLWTGTATYSNSIIANNSGGDCLYNGPLAVIPNHTIDSDGTCGLGGTGDIPASPTITASLLPLADNGGPTFTHALLAGSPALDAGSCVSATDQRGISRPYGASCDIGAYEAAFGCTDPTASNYDPTATVNDGSCIFDTTGGGGGGGTTNTPPYNSTGGGAEWLIYPENSKTGVNRSTTFKWYELTDDDGDEIDYDLQFCDRFKSGECSSWSSVNGRVATLRQAQGDYHLSLPGAEGEVAISGLPRYARNGSLSKTTANGAATAAGAFIFALGFIGAIRTRRGKALILALVLMTSGGVLAACGSNSSDDDNSTSSAITCDDVEDGVVCRTQSSLAANSEYTWRVIATDGKGGENISAIRSFTTGE